MLENSVSVISTASREVVAIVPTGTFPMSVSMAPTGNKAYITNWGTNDISVINTNNHTAGLYISLDDGTLPIHSSFSPVGDYAYVVNAGQNTISLLDPADNEIISSFGVGSAPTHIAFSPIGARAYAVNNGSQTLSIINTLSKTVISSIPVVDPQAASVHPFGISVYISERKTGKVAVLATSTNKITKRDRKSVV